MRDRDYDNELIEVVRLIADGQKFLAGVIDLLVEELTSRRRSPIISVGLAWSDGTGYTFTGADMDTTVDGRNVGDVVVVEVGPATDARGRPVGDVSAVTFEVSDPAVLGLEIDPTDVTPGPGRRAARVTILDTADATLTLSEPRPTKGPLTSTVRFTGTVPENLDQAVDLPFVIDPAPTTGPTPGPAVVPNPSTGQAAASRVARGVGF